MPGLSGDIDGLSPAMRGALDQLSQTCTVVVNSGFRTYAEQAALYDDYIHGRNGQAQAAPPGRSNHNTGDAVDLDKDASDMACINANAARLGLGFPVAGEDWHLEVVGDTPEAQEATPLEPDVLDQLNQIVLGAKGREAMDAFTDDSLTPQEVRQAGEATDPTAPHLKPGTELKGNAGANPAAPQTGANYDPGSRLSPVELAQVYYNAGFRGERLVEMVATSMGESGGDPGAHNDKGEDSRGISQINMDAHADKFGSWDLYDPQQNANAAFIVAGNGTNLGPWTVYTSGKYQQFMDEARAAVAQIGGGTSPAPADPAAEPEPEAPADLESIVLDPTANTGATKLMSNQDRL